MLSHSDSHIHLHSHLRPWGIDVGSGLVMVTGGSGQTDVPSLAPEWGAQVGEAGFSLRRELPAALVAGSSELSHTDPGQHNTGVVAQADGREEHRA